jgi:hypothetical protein
MEGMNSARGEKVKCQHFTLIYCHYISLMLFELPLLSFRTEWHSQDGVVRIPTSGAYLI